MARAPGGPRAQPHRQHDGVLGPGVRDVRRQSMLTLTFEA
ncbi:uncharacterized protein SOCEGT47_023310 [Sorangium cellulosum]|jgi:hypothetical protein|uniref:Uncharacterized protein n=1 Tax=Sorangium cellulosum TaxID=56 RepID=A0A4P2PZ09_SORCE|nr:uncharacterized protein SOCEGT47_023310 [Sorangium cellulosum]